MTAMSPALGEKAELSTRVVEAGCAILYEDVAEAFEPRWRELLGRIFIAMQAAQARGDQP